MTIDITPAAELYRLPCGSGYLTQDGRFGAQRHGPRQWLVGGPDGTSAIVRTLRDAEEWIGQRIGAESRRHTAPQQSKEQ